LIQAGILSRIKHKFKWKTAEKYIMSKINEMGVDDLILILISSHILVLVMLFFPQNVLRTLVGIPFILFFPGYVVASSIWPGCREDTFTRMCASLGLSIPISIAAILVPYYMGGDMDLKLSVIFLLGFIVVFSVVAAVRRLLLPVEERHSVKLRFGTKEMAVVGRMDRYLFIILITLLVGLTITTCYLFSQPLIGERFSELYLLDSEGKTVDYPVNLTTGEYGTIRIGVTCHEYRKTTYTIRVEPNNSFPMTYCDSWNSVYDLSKSGAISRTIVLSHEETFEDTFTFQFSREGDYTLICKLYIEDIYTGYEVRLVIHVT
jgi:uncharacterized membrane protein